MAPWRRTYRSLLAATWIGVVGFALMQGLEYYLTPLTERAYSPLHDTFKPAGDVGRAAGVEFDTKFGRP